VVIPTLGAGIVFNGQRLVYPLEYMVQHLSVCMVLLIQPLLRNIAVLDLNQQESNHYDAERSGHLAELRRYVAKCHIYRLLYLVASKISEMRSIGHEDQRNQCIPHSEL
jgi:hypothetical protein